MKPPRFLWLGLLGCCLAGGTARAGGVIGRSPEISAGREAASMVEKLFTVDSDPAAVARVRAIGRRLAASAQDTEFPFEFHVVESGEVNAFALPGGFVYVFRGLLQLLPNDDALAFVLGHEVSHVTRHHAARQFEKNFVLNTGITAALLGTGAGYNAYSAADFAQTLAAVSFTRHDEAEADAIGIDLVTRAGYNPRAAAESMEIIKRAGGDEKHTPALMRTHPAPDSRIRKLNELADGLLARRGAARAEVAAPPPPPTAPLRRLAGLESVEVAPCEWVPLKTGALWSYRVTAGGASSTMTVRVLEQVDAQPSGVFRVETDLGRGVKSVRLVAPAGDRYLSRPDTTAPNSPWKLEAVFAEREVAGVPGQPLRFAGSEHLKVPAGEFDTARVERIGADGKPDSILWFARGIGLVRRDSPVAGTVQELTSVQFPAR